MICVGGSTEVEVKEKKDRIDDAMHATKAAVQEGIVPGGGVALLRAKAAIGKLSDDNADIQAGINIVLRALEAPIRQIAENAGVEGSLVVGNVTANKSQPRRRICRHAGSRHRRPGEGRARRTAGRRVSRRSQRGLPRSQAGSDCWECALHARSIGGLCCATVMLYSLVPRLGVASPQLSFSRPAPQSSSISRGRRVRSPVLPPWWAIASLPSLNGDWRSGEQHVAWSRSGSRIAVSRSRL